MVPSDPRMTTRSPPGPLALNDAGKRSWRPPPLCSPLLLLKAAGLHSRRSSARAPVRSRHLEAVFHSLPMDARLRAAVRRSWFRTCLFDASRDLLQVRSACGSFADAGSPRRRRSPRRLPVTWHRSLDPGLAGNRRSLLGVFLPFRITTAKDALPGSSPSERSRSPLCSSSSVYRWIFRFRIFAPGPLMLRRLAVSSNLLEPVSIFPPPNAEVNQILNSLRSTPRLRPCARVRKGQHSKECERGSPQAGV
jgi:hypothetical protein